MRFTRLAVPAVLALFVASCGERATEPAAPRPDPVFSSHTACPTPEEIRTLIRDVFPTGGDRSAALSRFNQVLKALGQNRLDIAQDQALQLVDFVLKKFQDGRLIGGQSLATRNLTAQLLNGILCIVGLPPLSPDVLGEDGAAAIITPTSPTTTIVTGTEWAGVTIPSGAVTVPTLITIRRLPDSPAPLLTPFDQYPLFYEFSYTPGTTFTTGVLVGVCESNTASAPDPSRLRLAHNVAPYTWGSVEILPLEAITFLDCSDAGELSAAPSRWGFDLASGSRILKAAVASLLPEPLEATVRGGTGVGGTVRTFSPFGLVDTLAMAEAASPTLQQIGAGQPATYPPIVRLVTPTGRPMLGIVVDFESDPDGTEITPLSVISDAAGLAASTSWLLNGFNLSVVKGTVRAPAGTGFTGVPVRFRADVID